MVKKNALANFRQSIFISINPYTHHGNKKWCLRVGIISVGFQTPGNPLVSGRLCFVGRGNSGFRGNILATKKELTDFDQISQLLAKLQHKRNYSSISSRMKAARQMTAAAIIKQASFRLDFQ